MGEKSDKGAGFIIIHNTSKCILALIKESGKYDLPKGRSDNNESPLETAKRECFEECSILIEDEEILDVGPFTNGELVVFVAVTDKIPVILPNPESGITEHIGYKWVTPDEFMVGCKPYLALFIEALLKSTEYTSA